MDPQKVPAPPTSRSALHRNRSVGGQSFNLAFGFVGSTLVNESSLPFWTPQGGPKWRASMSGGALSARVVVFVDYQNMYKGARNAFCEVLGTTLTARSIPSNLVGFSKGSAIQTESSRASESIVGCPRMSRT
jgi:hypothetical protein